jgi:signal peptidase I
VSKIYRTLGWLLLICALLVGAARAVAIRWWQVPPNDLELGASVGPSLRAGDWVLLWRLTRPGVGDLVVCPDPDDPGNVVIGRIAAQAFDEVVLNGQHVLINGVEPDEEYNCTELHFSFQDPDTLKEETVACGMENLADKVHMRAKSADRRQRRKFKKKVESGRVFLLSDNRPYPFDSRHYGTVERHTCKETIFFRLSSKAGFFDAANRLEYIH